MQLPGQLPAHSSGLNSWKGDRRSSIGSAGTERWTELSRADQSLETDARKATYYSRLQEERKARKEATKLWEEEVINRERIQQQLESTENSLNQAELRLVDQKAHFEAQIDALKTNFSQQLLAVEARVKSQQREFYTEHDKRQVSLMTSQHKEQMEQLEIKFNAQLMARVNEIMAQEKAAYREQISGLNRTVEDLQKQLALLNQQKRNVDELYSRRTLDLQRLTIRLKIALRAEAQLRGYQNLLKYMAVKAFVSSWKHRAALRKLHQALAALVENALEFQAPSLSVPSIPKDTAHPPELEAWLRRNEQLSASTAPVRSGEHIAHLLDACANLRELLLQIKRRARHWRDTSQAFFASSVELSDKLRRTDEKSQGVGDTIRQQAAQIARLQAKLDQTLAAMCPCSRSLVCICSCDTDCHCVVGGVPQKNASMPSETDVMQRPTDRNEQLVKTLRARLLICRQAMTEMQKLYDSFRVKFLSPDGFPQQLPTAPPVFAPRHSHVRSSSGVSNNVSHAGSQHASHSPSRAALHPAAPNSGSAPAESKAETGSLRASNAADDKRPALSSKRSSAGAETSPRRTTDSKPPQRNTAPKPQRSHGHVPSSSSAAATAAVSSAMRARLQHIDSGGYTDFVSASMDTAYRADLDDTHDAPPVEQLNLGAVLGSSGASAGSFLPPVSLSARDRDRDRDSSRGARGTFEKAKLAYSRVRS